MTLARALTWGKLAALPVPREDCESCAELERLLADERTARREARRDAVDASAALHAAHAAKPPLPPGVSRQDLDALLAGAWTLSDVLLLLETNRRLEAALHRLTVANRDADRGPA